MLLKVFTNPQTDSRLTSLLGGIYLLSLADAISFVVNTRSFVITLTASILETIGLGTISIELRECFLTMAISACLHAYYMAVTVS